MWWDSHLVVRINKEDLRDMYCLHSIINWDRGSKPFSPLRWAQTLETSRLDQLSQAVWWAKRHWSDQGKERIVGREAQVRLSKTTTQHHLQPSPGTGCQTFNEGPGFLFAQFWRTVISELHDMTEISKLLKELFWKIVQEGKYQVPTVPPAGHQVARQAWPMPLLNIMAMVIAGKTQHVQLTLSSQLH